MFDWGTAIHRGHALGNSGRCFEQLLHCQFQQSDFEQLGSLLKFDQQQLSQQLLHCQFQQSSLKQLDGLIQLNDFVQFDQQ